MNIKTLNVIWLSFIMSLSFPCIVSGSETPNPDGQPSTVIKITSSDIRAYNQGDHITYTSSVAGSGIAVTGDVSVSISATVTNPSGKKCLEHTISSTYSGVGGPVSLNVRLLYFQDAQHSIYECGFYDNDKNTYVFITDTENTPDGVAMIYKSPMKLGNTTASLITFSDGSWKDCSRSVNSIDEISTGAGTFEAYKIAENCTTDSNNSNTSTAIWFVPNVYTIKEYGTGAIIAGDFILDNFVFN